MNKRGGHGYGTMAERIAATKAAASASEGAGREATPAELPAPHGERGPGSLRHCWVDHDHGRVPGLLIEWRRTASGWQGRVVHPVRDPSGWILVEEWLPAASLVQA
ncbi:hypothetical protein ISU10_04040 [Nocardioides agariphilus]|uniref:Uncharacterized protein n=2 Tax=Nocardioides agariphilus TaxID=433664 RepID=A0A930VJT4_9ACTN|nr:hypothetical protein [Nocardioides agariphilus]MBF4766936.1 hypothetical protein [Nocardioides agariphilus]